MSQSSDESWVGVLQRIAQALDRLAAIGERAYPPPPNREAVIPAGERAFSRPSLRELTQWEDDDKRQAGLIR